MGDWKEIDNALSRLFVFNNFQESIVFVNKVGELAEKMQHHPNITLQNYKEVFISTTTHDAGNMVTEKDQTLAEAIDAIEL